MNSVPAPPRARNVAKGSNSILSARLGLSIDHWPARCPWRRFLAGFRRRRVALGRHAALRSVAVRTLGAETCVRVAAARGRVLC